ncbi:MAG: YabP/YqfC family sporulation protein [Lachnospiraceae bacterium]|nr:YabP/YqfC family sporulation protein [Robinsoniella sp.]MDY3765416.1 YabP/YqfC family sporulation protein [Lachnospiraceae bacterium]
MSRKKKPFYQMMAAQMQIPKDLSQGAVLLSVTGRDEVFIENYKSILEYTNQRVLLQTKSGKLEVRGKNLHIVYYTCNEMRIEGILESIHY